MYSRTRHSVPRARMSAPSGSSPRVDRCSTSPSGNRRVRIGVVGIRAAYIGADGGRLLRFFDRLHVRGRYGASGDPRHAPKLALASHLLADRRKDPTGEVVLEVTVRVADQKGLCGNAAPPLVSTGRVPSCRSLKTMKCMDEHPMDVFRGQSLYDLGYRSAFGRNLAAP